MGWLKPRDRLDRAFTVAVVLKGLDGLLELLGGTLLLFLDPAAINRLVVVLTRHELSEDPRDVLANYLLRTAYGLTGLAVLLVAGYLITHGVAKIVLVVALLRDKSWAYPWMIGFLLVFIGYQLYRMVLAPSLALAALTGFDAVVAGLTYREYRRRGR